MHANDQNLPLLPGMAAIVVTYNSADVIVECLQSLLAQSFADLRIIVIDNASTDDTIAVICEFMAHRPERLTLAQKLDEETPLPKVLLFPASKNKGFAAGCNIGLGLAFMRPEIGLFWLVNPDCRATPDCARSYGTAALGNAGFALMGGRTVFDGDAGLVQSDGGRLSRWTAVCKNLNHGQNVKFAQPPKPGHIDFISGANMVASRRFLQHAGPMPEDYFLYYEEVDWALQRGKMPLRICRDAVVYHQCGTSAGSGNLDRRPSAFSNYFNYRNRLKLAWRHRRKALPGAYIYSILKIGQLCLRGAIGEAWGAFLGLHQLQPTRAIRSSLEPESAAIAFGPATKR